MMVRGCGAFWGGSRSVRCTALCLPTYPTLSIACTSSVVARSREPLLRVLQRTRSQSLLHRSSACARWLLRAEHIRRRGSEEDLRRARRRRRHRARLAQRIPWRHLLCVRHRPLVCEHGAAGATRATRRRRGRRPIGRGSAMPIRRRLGRGRARGLLAERRACCRTTTGGPSCPSCPSTLAHRTALRELPGQRPEQQKLGVCACGLLRRE